VADYCGSLQVVIVYCKGDDIPKGLDRERVKGRDRIEVYLMIWRGIDPDVMYVTI